jgi:branched-chain amino acid transport system permease protein
MSVVRSAVTPAMLIGLVALATFLGDHGPGPVRSATAGALITLLLVIGLQVFSGNSGVFSFGHAAFMAVGAYAGALAATTPQYKQIELPDLPGWLHDLHLSNVPAVLLAGALASVFGAVVAVPLVRLSGLAASLATVAMLVVVHDIAENWDRITRGTPGFIIDAPAPGTWALFPWAAGAIVVAWLYKRSPGGLRLIASREDPVAAVASGIRIRRERAIALVVSAFLAGAAGALFALHFANISPLNFYLSVTFTMVAMLVVGGAESLSGAVVGVIVVTTLLQLFRQIEDGFSLGAVHIPSRPGLADFGLALGLLGILILRPRGVTGGREVGPPRLPRLRMRVRPSEAAPSAPGSESS